MFFSHTAKAQSYLYPVDSIYLSGMVYSADSLNIIEGAHVMVQNKIVAITNADGQFIVFMNVADTLQISYLGYLPFTYFFSEKLFEDEYFMRIPLRQDTIIISEVEIYPWPKKGAFRQAFLAAQSEKDENNKIIIIGAQQKENLDRTNDPKLSNPASLLQEKLGKKARQKRKQNKYRKKLQKNYFEHDEQP